MNKFKKIGLSALAGSLAAVSANAAEYAVTGDAYVSYQSEDSVKSEAGSGKKSIVSRVARHSGLDDANKKSFFERLPIPKPTPLPSLTFSLALFFAFGSIGFDQSGFSINPQEVVKNRISNINKMWKLGVFLNICIEKTNRLIFSIFQ